MKAKAAPVFKEGAAAERALEAARRKAEQAVRAAPCVVFVCLL